MINYDVFAVEVTDIKTNYVKVGSVAYDKVKKLCVESLQQYKKEFGSEKISFIVGREIEFQNFEMNNSVAEFVSTCSIIGTFS